MPGDAFQQVEQDDIIRLPQLALRFLHPVKYHVQRPLTGALLP